MTEQMMVVAMLMSLLASTPIACWAVEPECETQRDEKPRGGRRSWVPALAPVPTR